MAFNRMAENSVMRFAIDFFLLVGSCNDIFTFPYIGFCDARETVFHDRYVLLY